MKNKNKSPCYILSDTHWNNYRTKFWPILWHQWLPTSSFHYENTWEDYDDRKRGKKTYIKKNLCLFIFMPKQSIISTEGQIFEILLVLVSSYSYSLFYFFSLRFLIAVQWIWHFTLCWRRLGRFLPAPTVWLRSYTEVTEWVEKRKQRGFGYVKKKLHLQKRFS